MTSSTSLGVMLGWLLFAQPGLAQGTAGNGWVPGTGELPLGPVETILLDHAVSTLSAWVAEHRAYREPAQPGVAMESEARLKQRCFPAFPVELIPEVKSAYDPQEGTIYLREDFDIFSALDYSFLLHEIVHHFQVRNRADEVAPCRGALEGEAIRLQLDWLREQGNADPFEVLGIDTKTLRIIERCPNHHQALSESPAGSPADASC
ncbi:DUF6647 family protein [Halomonas nitroreducens]|uniref:DUF6647 domain-containing protein n=1 Tax=Halomonas nitroreducens TaxID=447425 RepID=A0A431UZR0_9GAMM|nr:DUF6647 family protein [Halomonas nitroreducens]RTQ99883.1 hypothetical protein EKG36_16765 [Halomonas nitroreducens]